MSSCLIRLFAVAVFLSYLLAAAPIQAQQATAGQNLFNLSDANQYPPPEQVFQLDYHQQDSLLKVSFKIPDGYYLYQHRIDLKPADKVFQLHPLPEAIEHQDLFFGDTLIYRDELSFTADLNAALRNETIEVHYQGCADEGYCYPPSTQTIFLRKTSGAQKVTSTPPKPEASAFGGWTIMGIFIFGFIFLNLKKYAIKSS